MYIIIIMSREIIIKIEDKKIKLILKNKNKIIDEFFWEEERNLSQRLLVEIDNLLRKNDLTPKNIKEMRVETDIDDKFTTARIAKITAKTFNEIKLN